MGYSRLFRLLALVQFALHCSKHLWQELSGVSHGLHHILVLRHKMHHFVLILQRFLLVDVIATEFAKLETSIMDAVSLDAILDSHTNFLEACIQKSFLGLGAEELLRCVSTMLFQVVRLRCVVDACVQKHGVLTSRSVADSTAARQIGSAYHEFRDKLKISLPDGDCFG